MKVAIVSTYDSSGGAGKATYRLFNALKKSKVDYFVKNKTIDEKNIFLLKSKKNYLSFLEKDIQNNYISKNRTNISNTLFSFSINSSDISPLFNYDIINLHWIEDCISLFNLYELVNTNKHIIWTLHDMKPFTGGCHYNANCDEYQNKCNPCLQLSIKSNLPMHVLKLKETLFKKANITIVTPSKWLSKEAKKSRIFKNKNIFVIPNSIDTHIFKPIDKLSSKQKFNIDKNSIVLSFGVIDNTEIRKGFNDLIRALQIVKENKKDDIHIVALTFGKTRNDFPIPTINVGHISDENILNFVYNAADIFILTSLEDNLPNTILESMSAGTPVIAYNTGGAKDIINNKNGEIIEKGNTQQLAKSILKHIEKPDLLIKKSKQARLTILNNYTLHHQAEKYQSLFKSIKTKQLKISKPSFKNINSFINNYIPQENNISIIEFAKVYSNIYQQIISLENSNYKYIIYGNGSLGKTIQKIIPHKIIGYVDLNDNENHPSKLLNLKFDKIIISVLGREDEIIQYLINTFNFSTEQIIRFNIR